MFQKILTIIVKFYLIVQNKWLIYLSVFETLKSFFIIFIFFTLFHFALFISFLVLLFIYIINKTSYLSLKKSFYLNFKNHFANLINKVFKKYK